MAILDRLPTKDRLVRFGIAVDSSCGLCRSSFESRDHIFSDCAFAMVVWHAILHACGLSQEPLCCNDLVRWLLLNLKGKSLMVQVLKLAWSGFIYFIWEERNHRLFRVLAVNGDDEGEETMFLRVDSTVMSSTAGNRCLFQAPW
ncbi:hypothetical protein F3Y22_tig00110621pilonHSYRG00363 [Hibiscus syriacus]|uniref:Reverse transcriptase zinc-binding domain-containing protein n=1 Tax=Hibiscus syriacus TaxID=106335 RepID=A0A6A3A2G3_HIBSY|nr:hypothetical protein F3Y22_tig00110621pilonHSYRG00363 [Hibiscus syriacus]